MEDNAVAITQFLKEFTSEKISPTSDDEVQIRCGIVGNYSLKPEEIEGEVTDWVLNYLEQRKCPHFLSVALAKKVAQKISTGVCQRLLQSNGENIQDEDSMLRNATALHSEAVGCLHDLTVDMRDHPEQMEVPVAQKLRFNTSVFAIKNGRRKMEDRHIVLDDLNAICNLQNAPSHSYYAVFDGHVGVETASFASAHLHKNIVQHPAFLKDTKTAIIEAFKLTDAQFAERATRENLKSGATAVCALIGESTLYIAWLGDSQALLVKHGKPYSVMNPHKPEREDERKRIEEMGGYIYHHGTWRVNGTLAVSRALGDAEHKPFVSNEPEVNVIPLDGTEDFLIIACDGLWDKMSPSDVSVSLYRHLTDNPKDADSIAAKLVHQSKVMGSTDNITTIVVFLRDIPSLIAEAPRYAADFPQLEGMFATPVSQMANGATDKNCISHGVTSETPVKTTENKCQRPTCFHKDLEISGVDTSDWSPEMYGRNGKFDIAVGVPPEQTSLSELPTPPIDEVVASKQFSEYSTSEQLKIFQEHLEAQGFHDISLREIETSMSENLQFAPSEIQDDMGYLSDKVQGEIPKLPFESLVDVPQPFDLHSASLPDAGIVGDQVMQHITHEEVLSTASDLVFSTIETAVKHVSSSDLSAELKEPVQENFSSSNPFDKQEVGSEDVNSPIDGNIPSPVKSTYQLNPNAEPFVMRKDFVPFEEGSVVDTSTVPPVATTGDLSMLEAAASLETHPATDSVDGGGVIPPVTPENDLFGNTVNETSDIHSPLPSAPPLDIFSEEQGAYIPGECIAPVINNTSRSTNPFLSDAPMKSVDVDSTVTNVFDESLSSLPSTQLADLSLTGEHEEIRTTMSEKVETSQLVSVQPDTNLVVLDEPENNLLAPEKNKASPLVPCQPETKLFVLDEPENSLLAPDQLEASLLDSQPPDNNIPPPKQFDANLPASIHPETSLLTPEELDASLLTPVQLPFNLPTSGKAEDPPEQIVETSLAAVELVEEVSISSKQENETDLSIKDATETSFVPSEQESSSFDVKPVVEVSKSQSGIACASDSTVLPGESQLVSEVSAEKSSDANAPDKESSVEVKENKNTSCNEICADDISKEVTKQVIGKDSLLPKEVQDKLLEVTATTARSDSAPAGAVAVDLQTIPDGVPEAEGVTEDMDSDSEKDGGWSYVKATGSSREQNAAKKVDASKTTKKVSAVPAKDKKAIGKPMGEARSKPRTSVSGSADASKKVALEKMEKKVAENKDKSGTVSKTLGSSKTLTSETKTTKKTTLTRITPSTRPTTTAATTTAAAKQPVTKTATSFASKLLMRPSEKGIGKPAHSSTPFRPNLTKPAPSATGTVKPLTRPASATSAKSSVTTKQNSSSSSQKPQPRAASAPLASRTLPSTKASTTESKTNGPTADAKTKPTFTFRKPLPPPAKKQDIKEVKDSANKQIVAKKGTQVTATQPRRTGMSTTTAKIDSVPKRPSTTAATDAKTLKMSTARTDSTRATTLTKMASSKGKVILQSKQPSRPAKPESGKKVTGEKPSKNGPKSIVSDQKVSPDNHMQEASIEKGMLEANAKETVDDKSTGAGVGVAHLPASEELSKSELKQELNVMDCPAVSASTEGEKL